jgi:ankyrin repeat protein
MQNPDVEKASQFVSGVVPERYRGELTAKLNALDNSANAQIQAAEVVLSMLANNHKSVSNRENSYTLRKWIMEIPLTLLALIIQRKNPTAIAITNRILEWSISRNFDEVFWQMQKANIDKSYLTGANGGRHLLIALSRSDNDEIVIEILKYGPSLDTADEEEGNSPLHLAVKNRDSLRIVEALVGQGANTAARNEDQYTPPEMAVIGSNLDITTWFLENGATSEHLDQLIDSDFVPEFQICKILWEKHPTTWPKLSARMLVFAAIQGPDEFKAKAEELSIHYEDVNPILEEALCMAMKLLPEDSHDANSFHEYYDEQTSNGMEDDEHWEENEGLAMYDVSIDFLQYGVDANARSISDYQHPLAPAIMFWPEEVVRTLLDHGARLGEGVLLNTLLPNTLLDGLSRARFDVIKYILLHRNAGLNMNGVLSSGLYPLQAVCKMHRWVGGLSIVRHLVENGAELNGRASSPKNYTALHFAVRHGQLNTVRYLIEKGAKVRGWLQTPHKNLFELCLKRCYVGCKWGRPISEEMTERIAIFDLLLETRAEMNDELHPGRRNLGNCLASAILNWPNSKLAHAVMKAGAGVDGSIMLKYQGGPFSSIQLALKHGDHEMAKLLVEKGADINEAAGSYYGGTALQLACTLENDKVKLDLVKYLLDHGADVDAVASKTGGKTALQQACSSTKLNFALVKLLLDRGADVNGLPAENHGRTALQIACTRDETDFKLIHLLLNKGADINQLPAEYNGRTALQVACTRDEIDFKLIHLLLDKGADINSSAAPYNGVTALQGAVIGGNVELVLMLLERGAKVDAEGAERNGRTALEAAGEHGRLTIAGILLNMYNEIGSVPQLERAIALADKEGHLGVVRLFEAYSPTRLS